MRYLWALALLAACGSNATGGDDDDDVGPPGDAPPVVDAGPDGPPAPVPVRFVLMGDTGEGNTDQAQVASVVKSVCDAAGG